MRLPNPPFFKPTHTAGYANRKSGEVEMPARPGRRPAGRMKARAAVVQDRRFDSHLGHYCLITGGPPDWRREPVGSRSSILKMPCGFNSRSFRCGRVRCWFPETDCESVWQRFDSARSPLQGLRALDPIRAAARRLVVRSRWSLQKVFARLGFHKDRDHESDLYKRAPGRAVSLQN